MPFGGQKRDLCALSLQQRVGCYGRAMDQPRRRSQHRPAREPQARSEFVEPGHHADRLVVRRRERLREHCLSGFVDGDEVRERAADINSDRQHASSNLSGYRPNL